MASTTEKPRASGQSLVPPPPLANELGVTEKTLAQWRWQGRGPRWFRLEGGGVRYLRSDVDDWIETQRTAGQKTAC